MTPEEIRAHAEQKVQAEMERCLRIIDRYAVQEREDRKVCGSAVVYGCKCAAAAIREGRE